MFSLPKLDGAKGLGTMTFLGSSLHVLSGFALSLALSAPVLSFTRCSVRQIMQRWIMFGNQSESSTLSADPESRTGSRLRIPLAPIIITTKTTNNDGDGLSSSDVDSMKCPITLELILHPVVAEDCQIYEKFAIEDYIKSRRNHGLKIISPATHEPIGDGLVPAPWVKSCIERLIKEGKVPPKLVASWNERLAEEKYMKGLVPVAEGGDPGAMLTVGLCYYHGEYGFKRDATLAYRWLKRAHDAGDIRATAEMGIFLAKGKGVKKNKTEGIMYMGIAAVRGSDVAAYNLGLAYAYGWWGLPVNLSEAQRLLEKCSSLSCSCKAMTEDNRNRAREVLQLLYLQNSELL